MRKWISVSFGLIVTMLLLTGCFNFSQGIKIPLGDGESVTIGGSEEGGFSISLEGEDGAFSFSSDGESFNFEGDEGSFRVYQEIPDGFPSEVPLPEDFTPVGNLVTQFEDDTVSGYTLSYAVEADSIDEIVNLYKNFLSSNNYDIVEEHENDFEYGVDAEKGQKKFSMYVSGTEDGKVVMMTVGEEK
ncbi:hypothetical protein [Evansella tamaricis]|uniref:Lipoprotein n=1 Tax=Evansella tamaricis TaxID=2069301 RepID=A0ABS6JK78_9BACI|nr:hypothetical protein [Evansella tamaricis]MBU9713604.1 hypothetical protein [Evansella tamaricis]